MEKFEFIIVTCVLISTEFHFNIGSSIQTATLPNKCIVDINGKQRVKTLGDTWPSDNPCIRKSCELNELGVPFEKDFKEYCVACDDEFERISIPDSCCGKCIQTKCKYENHIYKTGESWKSKDNCTILQCDDHNGVPMISAYQKSCPKLQENCPKHAIYEEDCCLYCKSQIREIAKSSIEDEIYDENFYKNHPCNRECDTLSDPKVCHYKFTIEWYETLSKACYDCPNNRSDCYRPHCIFTDGVRRSVTVINRMMPGPSIEVCFNDTIVVDVKNQMLGESTTIHWHGIHQKDNPYMDGVPHISQCPILPHAKFRYIFKAENIGTHFWHSHVGMQRGDGAFGALIIRQPKYLDHHGKLYDFDEHTMLLQDWAHIPGAAMFASHHHSIGDNKPPNILINGKGRNYPKIHQKQAIKETSILQSSKNYSESSFMEKENQENNQTLIYNIPVTVTEKYLTNNTEEKSTIITDDVSLVQSNPDQNMKLHEVILNPLVGRKKRSLNNNSDPLDYPLETFSVVKGFSYRFRLINAEFLNCPMALSIDNHTLTVINSDGFDMKPIEVTSLVSYAGERFDFILRANQEIGNYWMRFKGLMDCDERFTKAFQVAILKYENSDDEEPTGEEPSYEFTPDGIELNSLNTGSGNPNTLTMAEVNSMDDNDNWILQRNPDYKFYIYYDFYPKDNPYFHKKDLYGFNNVSNPQSNRLFLPQLNHISLKPPSLPLMPAKDEINDSIFCNDTSLLLKGIDCRKEFCECSHVLRVPKKAIVEFILVDEGITYDANHPFHLHGYGFKVVGLERVGKNVTIEQIKEMDAKGLLKRKLTRAISKDTITVPDGGYTILRFEADNPGYWLFHCHIEFHAEIGMALLLKVGEHDEMKSVPKNFPTCFDYMPNIDESNGNIINDKDRSNNGCFSAVYSSLTTIVIILGIVLSKSIIL